LVIDGHCFCDAARFSQCFRSAELAARRLRRWLKGMFGGERSAAEPDEPGREEDS